MSRISQKLILAGALLAACGAAQAQNSWVELAVHNFGAPINTML